MQLMSQNRYDGRYKQSVIRLALPNDEAIKKDLCRIYKQKKTVNTRKQTRSSTTTTAINHKIITTAGCADDKTGHHRTTARQKRQTEKKEHFAQVC